MLRILLVDDSDRFRSVVKSNLLRAARQADVKLEITEANSFTAGKISWEMRSAPFDAVVSDQDLERVSPRVTLLGSQLRERIREKDKDVPFFLMSSMELSQRLQEQIDADPNSRFSLKEKVDAAPIVVRAAQWAEERAQRLSAASPSPGKLTILVVDESRDTRENLAAILGDEGYRVILAESGTQAVKILNEDVDHAIDGVLSSQTLRSPQDGVTGMKIYDYLRGDLRRPDVAFGLASSGDYRLLVGKRDTDGDRFFTLIDKPLTCAKLDAWLPTLPRRTISAIPSAPFLK
jgi:CheY-like chemotaxis protein